MPLDENGNEIPIEKHVREVDPEAFSPFFQDTPPLPDDDDEQIPPAATTATSDDDNDQLNTLTLPNGRKITTDELESLADFNDFISTNPSAWNAVQRALQTPPVFGGPAIPPSPVPPEPVPAGGGYPTVLPPPAGSQQTIPEEVVNDPAMLAMWQRTQAAEQRIAQFEQQYQQQTAAQRQSQLQQSLSTARTKFAQEFKLDDKQMDRLLWHVADANIATAFVASNPNDPTSALFAAMETTFYRTPAFRDQFIHERDTAAADEKTKATQRKRKASSLSGGSGTSAPPAGEHKRPASQQEKTELLAGAIRQIRASSE